MSYSANDNQNCFVQSGRTTSRVMAQPGGQSSFFLGGWTPEELEHQRQQREQRDNPTTSNAQDQNQAEAPDLKVDPVMEKENGIENQKEEASTAATAAVVEEKSVAVDVSKPAPVSTIPGQTPPAVSSNAFASSSSTNSFNVISERPTSRVLAPPGGQCSIRLG